MPHSTERPRKRGKRTTPVSEYEHKRDGNVAANQAKLVELGLQADPVAEAAKKAEQKKARKEKADADWKKECARREQLAPKEMVRRSARGKLACTPVTAPAHMLHACCTHVTSVTAPAARM